MSLKSTPPSEVPEQTKKVAQAAFPKGNPYMQMRDEFGPLYTDEMFADLYPKDGQPAILPWRLALVTIMQFAENLSDRQAADAVRARIDWKYALGLELDDPGFNFSVLSEFRKRLVDQESTDRLLTELLNQFKVHGLLKGKRHQRTDSTHVLAAVRELNRLENVGETMRHTLNCLAQAAPGWVKAHTPLEWFDRYGKRFENWRLPKKVADRDALADSIGADGYQLLTMVYEEAPHLWDLPCVQLMRRVWVQQYACDDGRVYLRPNRDKPPEEMWIRTPYDEEARYSRKRQMGWMGYKTHVTETCAEDAPRLITHVATTMATRQDCEATVSIQNDLVAQELAPDTHLVDAGYVNASNLASSHHDYDIDLLGPTRPDTSWQAKSEDGFGIVAFDINWDAQQATCPAGCTSQVWAEGLSQYGTEVVRIHFSPLDCGLCSFKSRCTRGTKRGITIRSQAVHEQLCMAREREQTDEFWDAYKQRNGVEGTISQGVRRSDLRQSRYIGLAKTHLQCVGTAAALNVIRAINWLNEVPLALTRTSHFSALAA